MKKITIYILALMFIGTVNAQNFKITDYNGKDVTNMSDTIYGSSVLLEKGYDFENISNDTIGVTLKRYETTVITGTGNYFCWGDCHAEYAAGDEPLLFSFEPIKVGPNEVNSSTHVYLNTHGISGMQVFLYVYYDDADPTDSAFVEVVFNPDPWVGIDNKAEFSANVSASPNPANDQVRISYDILNPTSSQASIVIVDLLGKELNEIQLNNNKGYLNINTSEFNSGIYFYSVRVGNKVVSTEKLIIN